MRIGDIVKIGERILPQWVPIRRTDTPEPERKPDPIKAPPEKVV